MRYICSWSTRTLFIFCLIHGEKYFIPSLTKTYLGAEPVFLETILQILLLKKPLIILYGVKWFSFLAYCTHNLTACRIYIVFLPFLSFFALSFHIVLQTALCLLYTSSLIRFLLLPYCVICLGSISLLPDTPWLSSFHFHDNPATPLDCEIAFTAFSFSPSLSLSLYLSLSLRLHSLSLYLSSSWHYFAFCN